MKLGWEMAFIIIGGLGFIWMFFWAFMYDKPEHSKRVNAAELEYIHQDDAEEAEISPRAALGRDDKGWGATYLSLYRFRNSSSQMHRRFMF
jgi:ACS family hexuronate transporter-like MFS transporter